MVMLFSQRIALTHHANTINTDEKMMIKKMLVTLTMCSGMAFVSGCSSIMSHTGGKEGTYPGTRASATMISESDTNWGTKSLAILDMPFTAVLDTVLLPWDLFRKDNSVRSRVEKSEERTQAANAVIPPAEMPAP
jgi:uncharacterized protein YceK